MSSLERIHDCGVALPALSGARADKPVDLPVLLARKFELVINLQTAKVLRLGILTTVLARTDEVIE